MTLSRRKSLALIGGGIIVAAGAAGGGFALTRTPHKALAPWDRAGQYADPRMRALSYAILAPNPHNRQPWEVDLRTPGEAVIWRDKTRNLPETDPLDRQLTIGMGCFAELLSIAAGETGHTVAFEFFPDGDDGPVAIARLSEGGAPDPLFAHVMDRRSCKEPFTDQRVDPDQASTLTDLATIHLDTEMVDKVRKIAWDAFMIEVTTEAKMKESVDLFRMGKSEINANPDGIDLGGPFLESLMLFGMLTREGQLDPSTKEFEMGLYMYREMFATTHAFVSLVTDRNTRLNQIAAGRRWMRLNLTTTALGLALHPVSQALQEYEEVAAQNTAIHQLLAKPGQTVQMLGRLGYGPQTPRTPRWALETRLRNA
ncbi:MAG: twin-arginine translocation pathway signal protein [Pseudomonadota bacterium]